MFLGESSEISFDGNTTVTCKGNKANENGGAIVSNDNCSVTFNGNSKVIFSGNKATTAGGAVFCSRYSHLYFQRSSKVHFTRNIAKDGGAITIKWSKMYFTMGSLVKFNANSVNRSCGAIYLSDNYTESDLDVIFYHNKLLTLVEPFMVN